MRREMVAQLVRVPPSQRLVTHGIPQRSAWARITSRACFLVATKSTLRPAETVSLTACSAASSRRTVCARSRMWMPWRSVKM